MMKIGVLTQWYPPEPGPAALPGELASELARRGHDVQVVTGFPNYPQGRIQPEYKLTRRLDEVRDGVKVRRVALFPSHSESAAGRVLNLTSFGASVLASAVDTLRDCDVIWVSNSPPTVAWAMRRLRRAGVPLVLHVLDVWPDNMISSGMAGKGVVGQAALKVADALTTSTYECADRVLTISPSVADLLASRGVPRKRLAFAPLWANESVFKPTSGEAKRQEMGVPDDKVVVLYAGAIGASQDLESLVEALELLPRQAAEAVECWIIGDGVGARGLESQVRAMPATAPVVRLLGRLPMGDMPEWTAAADISYVALRPDEHSYYTLPSKVQTTAAMGKPLLASVPGDVHRLVEELGLGFSSGGAGAGALCDQLQQAIRLGRDGLAEMGAHARQVYDENFSLQTGVDRIESLLAEIAGATTSSSGPGGSDIVVEAALRSDIPQVVDVHMAAFRGFFLTFLGPRVLHILYDDLRTQPEATLIVARRDGRVVGFVGGVTDEGAYFVGLKKREALGLATACLGAVLRNPRIVPRLWRGTRRGEQADSALIPATMLSMGVAPEAQGAGVGGLLVEAYRSWLKTQGATQYKLTTDARDNEATIGFHRRHGLEVSREYVTPEGREMLEFQYLG